MSDISKSMVHIAIASDPDNGLAEMLSGYLQHYHNSMISISLYPGERSIPDAIKAVLSEDGIHHYGATAANSHADTQWAIEINECSCTETRSAAHKRYVQLYAANHSDKASLRALREEAKTYAIGLLGEIRFGLK